MGEFMFIAANWKMNVFSGGISAFERMLATIAGRGGVPEDRNIIICPPSLLFAQYTDATTPTGIAFGGQDCSPYTQGAFTGEISAHMLAEAGAKFCIIGHSERREHHSETDAVIAAKAICAQSHGLTPIICVGEPADMTDAAERDAFLVAQTKASTAGVKLAECLIAYEPLSAIGTGKTPTPDEIHTATGAIKSGLGAPCPVLYGGSVKPANAREIYDIPSVDGVLVGGASLKADSFLEIIYA